MIYNSQILSRRSEITEEELMEGVSIDRWGISRIYTPPHITSTVLAGFLKIGLRVGCYYGGHISSGRITL